MPHVDITMIPGRNDAEKQDIARKVQEFLAGELGIEERFVSVSIEDVPLEAWNAHMEGMKGKKCLSNHKSGLPRRSDFRIKEAGIAENRSAEGISRCVLSAL